MTDFNQKYEQLKETGYRIPPQPEKFSWGDKERCKMLIEAGFKYIEPEIKFQWLPEYDNLVDWMVDTKGKGLALFGSSGRGKTLFLTKFLPFMFHDKGKRLYCIKGLDLRRDYQMFLAVDEIGREPKVHINYQEIDTIPAWIDWCADKNWQPFFTTNRSKGEFVKRYGRHIFNRVAKFCKIIEFKGESLWKT